MQVEQAIYAICGRASGAEGTLITILEIQQSLLYAWTWTESSDYAASRDYIRNATQLAASQ